MATSKLEFGQDCVYFDGADPASALGPQLAKVLLVTQDGAVCDLVVLPPLDGGIRVKKNVRHVDDPHYDEYPQQRRFGGFCTIAEHKEKLAARLAAKRLADARRNLLEQQQPVSPLKIPGVDGEETPEQVVARLHAQGRIPAFIAEIIDSPEWPLERVVQHVAALDAKPVNDVLETFGEPEKKPTKGKKEKEPALA